MTVRRDHISLKTKLASAICLILGIPHEHQELMAVDQVLSLVNWDHFPVRRDDGLKLGMTVEQLDHHSNITPKTIMAHRKKTAEIDRPQISKAGRCRRTAAIHQAKLALKSGNTGAADAALREVADKKRTQPKRKIQSRPMPGTRASGIRRRFGGVERWR